MTLPGTPPRRGRRWPYVLLLWALAELIVLWLVAQAIGWGWAILLIIIGVPVGWGILRRAAVALAGQAAAAGQAAQTGRPVPAVNARPGVTMAAGALIAIPGFIGDIVGLVLLIPPINAIVADKAGTWVSTRVVGVQARMFPGSVIRGTVIRPDGTDATRGNDESGRSGPFGELPG